MDRENTLHTREHKEIAKTGIFTPSPAHTHISAYGTRTTPALRPHTRTIRVRAEAFSSLQLFPNSPYVYDPPIRIWALSIRVSYAYWKKAALALGIGHVPYMYSPMGYPPYKYHTRITSQLHKFSTIASVQSLLILRTSNL